MDLKHFMNVLIDEYREIKKRHPDKSPFKFDTYNACETLIQTYIDHLTVIKKGDTQECLKLYRFNMYVSANFKYFQKSLFWLRGWNEDSAIRKYAEYLATGNIYTP